MFVSQETHNETNFLMLCVAIGCNSPFTTVNLLCANTTVCVCACVVISWQVFFLNPTSAASVEDYHHHMTSCIFPAVSELTCKDLTLVFSSFFSLTLFCGSVFVIHLVVSDERNASLRHSMAFPAPFTNCFDVCYLLNIGLGKILRTMSFLLRNADAAGTHSVCRNWLRIRLCL